MDGKRRKMNKTQRKKEEYESDVDVMFELEKGIIAGYQSVIGEKVKEHAQDLIDSLIQGALDGDHKVALELIKTYMPDKAIIGVKELKADTMKDINYAANKILDAKVKGKMDASLADDLIKNLLDRMNFILADELEHKVDMIHTKK